ncbi:MAG: lipoyl synthase [Sulfuriferula sp.]|nr:lipoyl synthase [Sulfuriferula sp.]
MIPIHTEPTRQPNAVRMPIWIRQNLGQDVHYGKTDAAVHEHRLHTVCEEARCPNRGECWSRGTATFMLLGDICTRACGFCAVKTGKPVWLDADEPKRVAEAVMALQLRYIVLTSVNRDDLADGGAGIFAETLRQLRLRDGQIGVEFLTPDFRQNQVEAVVAVMTALSDLPATARHDLVWGHNVETVPRLYQTARRGSKYARSLSLLAWAAQQPGIVAKSALMLGLGETQDEVLSVLRDLRDAGVSRVSLGQYLRPSLDHLPVIEYIHPDKFTEYENAARALGFDWVKAGPLVRSSYYAEEVQQSAL